MLHSSTVHCVQNQLRLLLDSLFSAVAHKVKTFAQQFQVCVFAQGLCLPWKKKKNAIKYVISHSAVTGEINLHVLIRGQRLNGEQRENHSDCEKRDTQPSGSVDVSAFFVHSEHH